MAVEVKFFVAAVSEFQSQITWRSCDGDGGNDAMTKAVMVVPMVVVVVVTLGGLCSR